MRQVVDGFVYDTETASVIHQAKYWPGHEVAATGLEVLYKTPNYRYFLFDQPSMFCIAGPRIIPKTQKEAVKWLERVRAPEVAFLAVGAKLRAG